MKKAVSQFVSCFFSPFDSFDQKLDNSMLISLFVATFLFYFKIFYKLLFLYLGLNFVDDYSPFLRQVPSLMIFEYKMTVWMLLFMATIAPLVIKFELEIWRFCIRIMSRFLDKKSEDTEESIETILHHSLSSYVAHLIPFLGSLIRFTLTLTIVYAGCRKKLEFTALQAFITLLIPLIFFLCLAFWWLVTIFFALFGV